MEYKLNIIGEFDDKDIERFFRAGEVKKSTRIVRYLILVSSIVIFLLASLPFLSGFPINTMTLYDVGSRIIILAIGVTLFFGIPKIKKTNLIGVLVCAFAMFIYAVHIFVFFSYGKMPMMFETFNVVILSASLFLMPNRWVVNMAFSLLFFVVYLVVTPHICSAVAFFDQIIAAIYAFWNIVIVGILFYRINLHKRQGFAKELQLEALSKTDHLTKIHNRKACDEFLDSSCNDNVVTSYIMFDIDNFKDVNDTYGHLVGDQVIVKIIETAKNVIRESDVIARWGGEEFIIIMPGTCLSAATEIAKRVREQISQIKHNHIKNSITCSFGVTSYTRGDTPNNIIRRVDQLLYLAKEYGKNRVVPG
jgi:diguanylate cyclase (GGDEF)-like protein